jgi:hypothetical protein
MDYLEGVGEGESEDEDANDSEDVDDTESGRFKCRRSTFGTQRFGLNCRCTRKQDSLDYHICVNCNKIFINTNKKNLFLDKMNKAYFLKLAFISSDFTNILAILSSCLMHFAIVALLVLRFDFARDKVW